MVFNMMNYSKIQSLFLKFSIMVWKNFKKISLPWFFSSMASKMGRRSGALTSHLMTTITSQLNFFETPKKIKVTKIIEKKSSSGLPASIEAASKRGLLTFDPNFIFSRFVSLNRCFFLCWKVSQTHTRTHTHARVLAHTRTHAHSLTRIHAQSLSLS